jgi:glycosyltransferase involved in cell wall biosynthesis
VVAAYAGGFRESIVHGENGLLVNADDGRAFAWAIIDLCRDSLRRSRLGQEGRRAAVRRDIQLEDRELLDLYAGLIRAPITEAACAA